MPGAQAYLTKDVLHDELIRAIHAVHAGEKYLPPSGGRRSRIERLAGRV